jgi:4-hydroxyphenylacetate 3-monooxygenase
MRTGAEYEGMLDDGRCVYLDGERVERVVDHPAFTGIVGVVGGLYEAAADPRNGMTYTAPETGREANRVFMIPRSPDDLTARHDAMMTWARRTHGFVGRSPDHVGSVLAGFASAPELFAAQHRDFSQNVTRFYRKVLDESLFVTYVVVPPQVDRAAGPPDCDTRFTQVGVCEERDGGMVVRGAQMLGTSSAIGDYLFVSCIKPLAPGDERYAISFVVPMSAPGLKLVCRRPYAPGQPSAFDYPLSTRFDETDALVIFDDVAVPWDHVFVYRDVDLVSRQWFATPAHVLGNNQAQTRLVAKTQFISGVARKIADANGIDRIPAVQERLADLGSISAIVEGMVLASVTRPVTDERGVVMPNPRFLYGAMGLQAELYPRMLHLLRELAGAGVMQVPASYRDLVSATTAGDVDRHLRSPGMSAPERVKLFKLAWDIVGSEFAGRHYQYEMFYAGAPFVAKSYAFLNYGFEEVVEIVEEFLASYGLEDAGAGAPQKGATT